MGIEKYLEVLKKGEIFSRVNSYIVLGEIDSGKSKFLGGLEGVNYIDFEKIAENLFSKSNMTLRVFDMGVFFREIKKTVGTGEKITIIDNLEIIENILYAGSSEGKLFVSFFKNMIQQSYLGKVIFVISDIKRMKIQKALKEANFPEKNIIRWGNNED